MVKEFDNEGEFIKYVGERITSGSYSLTSEFRQSSARSSNIRGKIVVSFGYEGMKPSAVCTINGIVVDSSSEIESDFDHAHRTLGKVLDVARQRQNYAWDGVPSKFHLGLDEIKPVVNPVPYGEIEAGGYDHVDLERRQELEQKLGWSQNGDSASIFGQYEDPADRFKLSDS